MTTKTLKDWEKASLGGEIPLGRRPRTPQDRRQALWAVAREMKKQGRPGWRPISRALPAIPVRLVQEYVAGLKARRRRLENLRLEAHRVQIRVLARNAVLAQDGTHLGRMGTEAVEAQVVKDPATMKTVQLHVGPPATGRDVLEHLEALEKSRGLPLVWQTDNGGCYVAEEVQAYLRAKRVVHLRSLPRTPEHNAYAESGIGELKAASRMGRGVVLASVEGAAEHLGRVSRRLDAHRLRASRGWKTSDQLDEAMNAGYDVDRDGFYATVQERKAEAVQGASSARKARQAEREAVYAVLEEFGLVSRLRGGRPISDLKPGDNS